MSQTQKAPQLRGFYFNRNHRYCAGLSILTLGDFNDKLLYDA